MKIVIVGLGLIGGSLGLALKKSGYAREILGLDNNHENLKLALNLGLIDGTVSFDTLIKVKPDTVILATPVGAICELLPRVLDLVDKSTTVTDVGSTKEFIANKVASHPKRSQYVAAHPMAGTENSGPGSAKYDLFKNKTVVMCDTAQSSKKNLDKVAALYDALQMRKIFMTSLERDRHAAYVSHLSHISSFILASTVLDIEKSTASIFDLAGGGFESTVRLGKSSPAMWMPIFKQNADNVSLALKAYIKQLKLFHDALNGEDWVKLEKTLTKANEIRRVLSDMGNRPLAKGT